MIKIFILLFSFTVLAKDFVKVDVNPGRFITHIYNYHFPDHGKFHHTQSTLWFSEPNNIHLEMEIYHYYWDQYKKEKDIKLTEQQVIDAAVIRMHRAINLIASRFQLPKKDYVVRLNKEAINRFVPPEEWVNFKLEE